jgi:hypothetical protein
MRLGRLFFAGAVVLGLAYFALKSPLPVADPRFIKEDFAGPGAAVSFSVFLDTGYARDRAHKLLADAAAILRKAEAQPDGAEAADVARAQALDRAAAELKAAGIRNGMLKFGGALVVFGKRGNAPWRIGLRDPRGKGPDGALAYVMSSGDEAIATRGDARVVTVIAADATQAARGVGAVADGSPEAWPELARRAGLEQVMVVDADGTVTVTDALGKRVKFLSDINAKVVP